MPKPVIDYTKCKGDKACMDYCPMGVFAFENNKLIVKNPEECVGCRACEAQCPHGAIKVED